MKNDELLITKLIEETCKEEETTSLKNDVVAESKVEDLSSYFEKRVNQVEFLSLKKYISQQSLNSINISYNDQTKCFRISFGEHHLDFPSNWSVFETLSSAEVEYRNRDNDADFLCDIFSELEKHCESFMLVNENGNYQLITFEDFSGKFHYEWVKNYFDNKREKEELKAA